MNSELGLSEKVDRMEVKDAFASLKDHKTDFLHNPKMRLINPSKQNLGKASKIIIANMVQKIKYAARLNLSRSTDESLEWFKTIKHGTDKFFLQLDIVNMYPSINYELVKYAITWAKSLEEDILPSEEKAFLH